MHRPSRFRFLATLTTALLLAGASRATAGGHARVLLIYSFGQNYAPYDSVATAFKQELTALAPEPVEFYEVALETARYGEAEVEQPVVDYLVALYARRRFDLVVPMGSPSVQFILRHRRQLFPEVPMLATGVEQRRLRDFPMTTNDAAVAVSFDLPAVVERMLQVLPATTNIALVFGASPLERFWAEETCREFQVVAGRVGFTMLDNLPLDVLQQRLAALPPQSAVFYGMFAVDANGEPFERQRGLEAVRAAANAPVFGMFDSQLGKGIVGGPLISLDEQGRAAAAVASHILQGEAPGDLRVPPFTAGAPVYDWRELKRWHIDPARLPRGSAVRFQELRFWQRYTWQLVLVLSALLAQTAIISMLLFARARRRRAEGETAELRRELTHAGRVATLGELSASLAHELNQPLTAILSNAQAALRFLAADPPDLKELRDILQDIVADDNRAGGIIRRLRDLAANRKSDYAAVEPNAMIGEALDLLHNDAVSRNVEIAFEAAADLAPVHGDRVQLQQVVLNLVLNAFDAMHDVSNGARLISVRTQRDFPSGLRVSVRDQGIGIAPDKLSRLFEPFYTTKPHGLGMGLPISRSIVEAHNGKLWAENNPDSGATFYLTLPDARPAS